MQFGPTDFRIGETETGTNATKKSIIKVAKNLKRESHFKKSMTRSKLIFGIPHDNIEVVYLDTNPHDDFEGGPWDNTRNQHGECVVLRMDPNEGVVLTVPLNPKFT